MGKDLGMSAASYFSSDYSEAAGAAGATLTSCAHPGRGPGGEDLAAEVAWLGPREAELVLVTVSGTHGAEGFCGGNGLIATVSEALDSLVDKSLVQCRHLDGEARFHDTVYEVFLGA